MKTRDLPKCVRLKARRAWHKIQYHRLGLESWILKKKLAYIKWKLSLLERAKTLHESREFQRGENDE